MPWLRLITKITLQIEHLYSSIKICFAIPKATDYFLWAIIIVKYSYKRYHCWNSCDIMLKFNSLTTKYYMLFICANIMTTLTRIRYYNMIMLNSAHLYAACKVNVRQLNTPRKLIMIPRLTKIAKLPWFLLLYCFLKS